MSQGFNTKNPRKTRSKLLYVSNDLDSSFNQNQSPVRKFSSVQEIQEVDDQIQNQNEENEQYQDLDQKQAKVILKLPLINQEASNEQKIKKIDYVACVIKSIDPISYYLSALSIITYFFNTFNYFILNVVEFGVSFLPQIIYQTKSQFKRYKIDQSSLNQKISLQQNQQFVESQLHNIQKGTIFKLKPQQQCPVQCYLIGSTSEEILIETNDQNKLYKSLLQQIDTLSGSLQLKKNNTAEFIKDDVTYQLNSEHLINQSSYNKSQDDILCISLLKYSSNQLISNMNGFDQRFKIIQLSLIVVSLTFTIFTTILSIALNPQSDYFIVFHFFQIYSNIIPSSLRLLIIILRIWTEYKINHCDQIEQSFIYFHYQFSSSQITGKFPQVLHSDFLLSKPKYLMIPSQCLVQEAFEITQAINKNKETEAEFFEQEYFESSLLTLNLKQRSKIDVCIQQYCQKQNLIQYTKENCRTIQYQDDNVLTFQILDQIREENNTLTTYYIDNQYVMYLRMIQDDKISIFKTIIGEEKYKELLATNELPQLNQLPQIEFQYQSQTNYQIVQMVDLIQQGFKLWIINNSENHVLQKILQNFTQGSIGYPNDREYLIIDDVEDIKMNPQLLDSLKIPCFVIFQNQEDYEQLKEIYENDYVYVEVMNDQILLNKSILLPEFSSIPILYGNHIRLLDIRIQKLINFHLTRCFQLCFAEFVFSYQSNFTGTQFYGQQLQFLSEMIVTSIFSLVFYGIWVDIPAQYFRKVSGVKSEHSSIQSCLIGIYFGISCSIIPLYELDGPNNLEGLVNGYSTIVIWSFLLNLIVLHLNTLLDRFVIQTFQTLTIIFSLIFNVVILSIYSLYTDEFFLHYSLQKLTMLKIMVDCLFVPLGLLAPILQFYYAKNLFANSKDIKPLKKLVTLRNQFDIQNRFIKIR